MTFETSISYGYADDERTIVRITKQSYFDIAEAEARVAAIDAELAALPAPKDPPTEDDFNRDMSRCGYSYESYVDMVLRHNDMDLGLQRRAELEHERNKLTEQIALYRRSAEGGISTDG